MFQTTIRSNENSGNNPNIYPDHSRADGGNNYSNNDGKSRFEINAALAAGGVSLGVGETELYGDYVEGDEVVDEDPEDINAYDDYTEGDEPDEGEDGDQGEQGVQTEATEAEAGCDAAEDGGKDGGVPPEDNNHPPAPEDENAAMNPEEDGDE